jgi:LuxR family maltose regulon positive regulatory protein
MSTPLLATKLYIPPVRTEWVRRPRLIQYLDEGLRRGHRLTLISAPAGSGKTSLVSAWAGQAETPFAWFSLDEDDNAPVRFLIYLIAALQTIDPGCGEVVLAALQSPQPPPARSVLPFLLHDVTTCPDAVLVLDDYHVIKERAVHDLVASLLQHLPRNLHLVIATRADPPLPLPRLRGRQQLSELRPPDLRFTDEEATAFFAGTMGLELSSQDVSALNTRTEGWITGLRMAAISMRGRDDTSAFVRSFTGSNRYILDYLVEEVLQQQPEDIQTFLLHTSILSDLSGDLCRAVTGLDDGQRILEEMEQANLFVVPLDDRRQWFRYHHLFADLLRQRLRLSAPDSLPDLHRRASAWHEQNNLLARAVEHALAAGDYERVVRLVDQRVESIWEHGEQADLTKWLAALPEGMVRQRPALLTSHAFVQCMAGQFEPAEAQLAWAENSPVPTDGLVRGMAATVRAYIALYRDDADAAAEYAHLALEHLPAGHHLWRCLATSILGDAHAFYGRVPTSERTWSQALGEAEAVGSTFFRCLPAPSWSSSKSVKAGCGRRTRPSGSKSSALCK